MHQHTAEVQLIRSGKAARWHRSCNSAGAQQLWQHKRAAERSYPTSKVRGGGWEELSHFQGRGSGQKELPHVQGKEQWLHFAWAAVKKYPVSKVRETQVRW